MRRATRRSSYDLIGNLAIVRMDSLSHAEISRVAEALMQRSKNVKTVLGQVGAVSGDLRLRKLRWIKGEKNYVTLYREHGCTLKVDLKDCYFSPPLPTKESVSQISSSRMKQS